MNKSEQILSLEATRDSEIKDINDGCDEGVITPEQRDACIYMHSKTYAEKIAKIIKEK